jgi:hypothetical protein
MRDRVWTVDKLIIGTSFAALIVAGIVTVSQFHQPANAAEAAAPAAQGVTHVNLMIVTDAMTGRDGFPAYVPSNFSLPANSTVQIRVVNYDDATPVPAQYAQVSGTVGNSITVQKLDPTHPNSPGPARTMSSMPRAQVSHTFTIKALGLNVPIAPMGVTTFTIHTGKAGVYHWHCYDPCGMGPMGWGTAMGTRKGFMEGTVSVVA